MFVLPCAISAFQAHVYGTVFIALLLLHGLFRFHGPHLIFRVEGKKLSICKLGEPDWPDIRHKPGRNTNHVGSPEVGLY